MIWKNFKNIIKKNFGKIDKKDWLDKLVENLETQRLGNVSLPFAIIDLKETGFVVKVSGLYAFISFNHMPWKYDKIDYWTAIYSKLIGKRFYCRIYSIKKDPSLIIILNGKIPQFKKTELQIGQNYRGIITEKVKHGLFVETGFHFDWRYGSFIGYLNKLQLESVQLFSSYSVGDEIEILYQGLNEKGMLIYSQTNEFFDWNNEIPQGLMGQIVLVHIVREQNETEVKFLVNKKYRGRIIFSPNEHFFGGKKSAIKAKNKLKDGDIIHCEVIGFKNKERTLTLRWVAELDSEIIGDEDVNESYIKYKGIANYLDNDTMQKLTTIIEQKTSLKIEQ